VLTVYDEEHLITYLRLLDAEVDGADWRDVARIVLHLDPELESGRARRAFDGHLSRAKWMTEQGYGTFYVVARRRKAQKRAAYVGGCFVVSIGGTSPSSQSCSLAKADQAASIRLYRRCKG